MDPSRAPTDELSPNQAPPAEVTVVPEGNQTFWPNIERWLASPEPRLPRPIIKCAICEEDLCFPLKYKVPFTGTEGEEAIVFQPCRHVLGRFCVHSWHARSGGHTTCPICRTKLSDDTVGALLRYPSAEDEHDMNPPMSEEQHGLWVQSMQRRSQNYSRLMEENEQELARIRAQIAEDLWVVGGRYDNRE